jgi:hypothetical protein
MMVCDLIVFQMDLAQKFREAATCRVLPLEDLTLNKEYSIVRARRLYTGYGGRVAFFRNIHDPSTTFRIYLPHYNADLVSDKVIQDINEGAVWLNLIYKEKNNDGRYFLEIS